MRVLWASIALFCLILCDVGVAADATATATSNEGRIPFRATEEATTGISIWRLALGFGTAVAVGAGALFLLKRFVPSSVGRIGGKGGHIDVLEIRRVTSRLTLFLVRVDGETVLLTQSGDRVVQLRLRDAAQVVAGQPSE